MLFLKRMSDLLIRREQLDWLSLPCRVPKLSLGLAAMD